MSWSLQKARTRSNLEGTTDKKENLSRIMESPLNSSEAKQVMRYTTERG